MQWHYSKNSSQLGPVEQEELLHKISTGEIVPTDLVWREGMADWLPVLKVSELTLLARPVEPQSASAADNAMDSPYAPPTTTPQHPVGPVSYGGPVMVAQGSGKATSSMVLGIVGLVFAICGCYGLAISLPCAILAIVFGGQFKAQAAANPALMGEIGKARAGVIMGWIAIAISVLFTVLLVVLGVASQAFSGMHQ